MNLRVLDLYCGAGCAGEGYRRAGFDVVGVDILQQPNNPHAFIQAGALEYLAEHGGEYDLIHASPPCQTFTVYRNCRPGHKPKWPDLIDATRKALVDSGRPWVMENVPGAPLLDAAQLCGTSFGIRVRRHRLFEASFHIHPRACDHGLFTDRIFPGSSNRPNGRTVCNIGEYRVPLAIQKEHMGVDWDLTLGELSLGIPPVYTEHVARSFLARREGAA
jgi:DNA (cytosine-5)-methyltransferase 1